MHFRTKIHLALLSAITYLSQSVPAIQASGVIDLERDLTNQDNPTVNLGIVYRIWHIEPTIMGIITILILLTGVIFFFCILFSGYQWLSAGGDSQNIAAARERLSGCLMGLSITMLAWAIMLIIQYFFGIKVFPTS